MDNECQTDEQQYDKVVQMNTKLKRALQILKDKIHRIVNERPDLFTNVGEETNERLDHLISTVVHQATQINRLQIDRTSTLTMYEEQLQLIKQERDALIVQQQQQQAVQSVDE